MALLWNQLVLTKTFLARGKREVPKNQEVKKTYKAQGAPESYKIHKPLPKTV